MNNSPTAEREKKNLGYNIESRMSVLFEALARLEDTVNELSVFPRNVSNEKIPTPATQTLQEIMGSQLVKLSDAAERVNALNSVLRGAFL
jgi:hypothetical protein